MTSPAHLIHRVTILGTGLIGGSFALALRKYTTDLHISAWDRPEVARAAKWTRAFDDTFAGELAPALRNADLVGRRCRSVDGSALTTLR